MNRKTISISLLVGLMAGMSACTEKYDIRLDDSFTRLVVDGSISTDTAAHQVRLTKTTSYFFNEAPPVVSGAQLVLMGPHGTLNLDEMPENPGVYTTPNNFYALPGASYTLDIRLAAEVGGSRNYTSVAQTPSTAFRMDSIALEYQQPFEFFLVKLYAWDPPTTDFYKFDALINGQSLTDTASRSIVINDRLTNGNNTNGLAVMFIRGDELKQGDTLTLVMSAISEDYYDFFLQLRTQSGSSNPLFSGPPANITSNVAEGGLGYFDSRIVQRISLVLTDDPKRPRKTQP
ncbi:MAG TPA: DUF4249 domain-containing protein [Bacteroidales bacterium]|nr:DUF4249 domain-containing protein [Bacteroidales bacterium]